MSAMIETPYLLFLGDATDALAAKTALGIAYWRREQCVGQLRLAGCNADAGLPDLTIAEAAAQGARTLVIGVANRGGIVGESWLPTLLEALEHGLDLANGLHQRLTQIPALAEAAAARGRRLIDVRHPDRNFPVATGAPRDGMRLLTVGTDCSVGKMFTSLAIEAELKRRGRSADFRATGQTGILIAGEGVPVDAVVADFIAGSVEMLAPEAAPRHWDLIEGQGSLFHPSYAGVSLGLLHGAQPHALVLCHEVNRPHMRGLPDYQLPSLEDCIAHNLACARLVSPDVQIVGVSLNTASLADYEVVVEMAAIEKRLELPCVDPVRTGVGHLVDRLLELFP
jgi:uncharacterized NAD-dependent epimerase/dehydratase family protein